MTTDGFAAYENAVSYSLGTRVDFAQLIKVYANNREGEQKYSPPEVVSTITKVKLEILTPAASAPASLSAAI